MKPHRDASALAARLSAAANTPVPLPAQQDEPAAAQASVANPALLTPPKAKRAGASTKVAANKNSADSRPITLRPPAELLNRYVMAAAERTREVGRVVSAQEVMIDVLERGRP